MMAYTTPIVALLWWYLDISIEFEDEDEDEEEEELDGNTVTFIPMGWPRKLPQEFYKGSDPEWQAFRDFLGNHKQHIEIQKQLVGRIRSAVGHHKQLARQLGAIDYEKGRVMLSINFPYGPPQMYEISGLLLTDNYIVWAAKTMPQIDYLRHRNAIFPTTAFWSVYASSKYLFNSQWQRAKDTLGWKDSVKKQSPFGGGSADQQSPWKGASNQQAPKIGPLPPVQPDASKRSGSEPSPHGAEVKSRPSSPPKMPPKIPLDNAALPVGQKAQRPDTFMIFMNTFMKNYAKTTSFLDPPRGSVVVSGLVEVRGAKGEATIDVVAAYDLKQSQYVIVSMTLRKLQPWEQRPKGGP